MFRMCVHFLSKYVLLKIGLTYTIANTEKNNILELRSLCWWWIEYQNTFNRKRAKSNVKELVLNGFFFLKVS